MIQRLYLHPPLERVWHGVHTVSILALILTGVNLRFPEIRVFGLKNAVMLHNLFGQILTVDFALWLPYLLITGRFRHYVPLGRDFVGGLIKQARFYALEVFLGKPHPFATTVDQKFNPLQKWAYIGVMFGLVPALIATGILLMLPSQADQWLGGRLHILAVGHRMLAYFAAAFLLSHIYMATMGVTPLDAFKSMVTGWANEHVHEPHVAGAAHGGDKTAHGTHG